MSSSVLHDVDVPLSGPDGAAALFGPAEGPAPEDVEPFDRALARLGAAFGGEVAGARARARPAGSGRAVRARRRRALGRDAVIELVGLRRRWPAPRCASRRRARSTARARAARRSPRARARRSAASRRGPRRPRERRPIGPLRALGARAVLALGPAERPLARAGGRG